MPDDTNDFAYWREQPDWARDLRQTINFYDLTGWWFTDEAGELSQALFGDSHE